MVFNGIFGIVAAGTVTIFLTLALLFILEMLM